jgi:hypothetical protein
MLQLLWNVRASDSCKKYILSCLSIDQSGQANPHPFYFVLAYAVGHAVLHGISLY